jgi:subtilisin
MKVKLIIISIILLLVIVFASGCIPVLEKLGLVNPTNEEQLSPEKGGPPDGLVKVLIGFKEKPGAAQQAMVRGVGGKIKYTYNLIPAIAASVPEVAIEALKKNPNITNVELDSMVYALDTELDNSWGVKRIGAGIVHDSGNNGEGIKIAIIDTGIDEDHPDLDDNIMGGVNFVSKPSWRTPDPNKWDDDNGHGTHVAGIIAAEDNNTGVVGVAPGADLYALKALDRTGSGYVSDVLAAIQWATQNDIQVINMSLGGAYDIFLDAACLLAYYFDGLILVASAGNGGAVSYPAAYDSVIAVSATNSADELAWFSSTGSEVELAAPGVDIYSTYKGGSYTTYSGTSMASPHVAGVAALVIGSGIAADTDGLYGMANEVRELLSDTAQDIGLFSEEQGNGLVDAENAVLSTTDGDDLPPTATGTISGTVTDADTGSPIVGGDVTANGYGTTTLGDGSYIISDLSVDSYTVTASATGYIKDSQSADVLEGGTTVVDFTLTPETTPSNTMHVFSIDMGEFKIVEAGPNKFYTAEATVTIFAVDTDGNPLSSPVEGATVYGTWSGATSDSDSGVTDANGEVSLESNKVKNPSSGTTFIFTVDNVEKAGWTCDWKISVTSESIKIP